MRHRVAAVLVPEPSNPYVNAVRVDIESQTVGYLERSDASTYLPGLLRLMAERTGPIGLAGVIVGGGQRHDGPGYLGVWLEQDRRHFGLSSSTERRSTLPQSRPSTPMRTGFSEAWLAELDNDSYELTWYSELPEPDQPAIQALRATGYRSGPYRSPPPVRRARAAALSAPRGRRRWAGCLR